MTDAPNPQRRAQAPRSPANARRIPPPLPNPALKALTSPPCSVTSCCTRLRPRPSPPCVRAASWSPCTNRLKMSASRCSAMPGPSSRTRELDVVVHAPQVHVDATASPGEFHRVVEQVADDLQQSRAIAAHPRGRGLAREADGVFAAAREGIHRLDGFVDHAAQFDGGGFQVDLAGGDAADVEQVVHQARQAAPPGASMMSRHIAQASRRRAARSCMIDTALRIGASGLRSSWPSIARNSVMRRPSSSSASTPALLGQVARDLGEAEQRAGVVDERGDHHVGPEARAVLAHAPALVLEAAVLAAPSPARVRGQPVAISSGG